MTEQVLDDVERMLDSRPYTGLEMLQSFEHVADLVL